MDVCVARYPLIQVVTGTLAGRISFSFSNRATFDVFHSIKKLSSSRITRIPAFSLLIRLLLVVDSACDGEHRRLMVLAINFRNKQLFFG